MGHICQIRIPRRTAPLAQCGNYSCMDGVVALPSASTITKLFSVFVVLILMKVVAVLTRVLLPITRLRLRRDG